jgi:hypothetical protein
MPAKRESAFHVLTGELPRGSWWSHPRANDIYDILQSLERHPDLLLAKLLAGKVTMIHRRLWPAVLAVVTAREGWQLDGLSPLASQALGALDDAEASGREPPPASRTVSKEIESRLLAHSESVHTSSGKHVTRLQPWKTWAARAGGQPAPDVNESKRVIEASAARMTPPPALPWTR